MTSVGCRSGVHWMRDGAAPVDRLPAIARASTVLAVPGTSSKQHVPAADHGGEDELDLVSLAVDDGLDVLQEPIRRRGRALEQVRPL